MDLIIFRVFFVCFCTPFFCFPYFIKFLKYKSANQPIYQLAPASHNKKAKTPTMGGFVIIGTVFFAAVLFSAYLDRSAWIIVFSMLFFGLIGFIDDFGKVKKNKNLSMPPAAKLCLQIIAAVFAVYLIYYFNQTNHLTTLSFTKNLVLDLGWFFYPFAVFVMVGTSNAVNLTDGLDGLAGLVCLTAFSPLLVISIINQLPLAIVITAILASCLAFLWFNTHPAQIMMGDVGSLALGSALGTCAILLKVELLLAFFGFIFVLETFSVILQVGYFKISKGKRIFKMAPIHHHFELLGIPESKVTFGFFIFSILSAIFGMLLYKI